MNYFLVYTNYSMIEKIFGNKTAEKVLLHIYHYKNIHASAIAKDNNISLTPVLNQLHRFEAGSILASKEIGRSRIYFLNQKSPFYGPISDILKIAYNNIPLSEREKIFGKRRRPRTKGKPIL
jgi:hypothetical protein